MTRSRPYSVVLVAATLLAADARRALADGGAQTTTDAAPPFASPAPTPSGDDPRQRDARAHYDRALALYDEGALDAALSELERAYELYPSSRMLYNLGIMSRDVHDSASAIDYLERYLAEGSAAVPSDMRVLVEEEIRTLAERVAQITIDVNVPGAEVCIDDRAIGTSPLGRSVRVNAGSRRVSARAEGRIPDSILISVAGKDQRHVRLTLSDAHPRLPPSPPPPAKPRIPWLGFGVTAVLASGAVVSGVKALSAQRDFERQRGTLGVTASELERADAKAFRWSVAADTLGLAALVAGGYSAYLVLWERDEPPGEGRRATPLRVALTPSQLVWSGAF